MYHGKRTDRLDMPRQLRMDESMGRNIRARAELSHRSIQHYLLHLIALGLKHEDECLRKAEGAGDRQMASVTSASSEPAPHAVPSMAPVSVGVRSRRMASGNGA